MPEFTIEAYSIEEIVVEKLRSLFQRARARDYYDLYKLLGQEPLDDRRILTALQKKSQAFDVNLDVESGIPTQEIEDVRDYWNTQLDLLVRDNPDFDVVADEIDEYLQSLAKHSTN